MVYQFSFGSCATYYLSNRALGSCLFTTWYQLHILRKILERFLKIIWNLLQDSLTFIFSRSLDRKKTVIAFLISRNLKGVFFSWSKVSKKREKMKITKTKQIKRVKLLHSIFLKYIQESERTPENTPNVFVRNTKQEFELIKKQTKQTNRSDIETAVLMEMDHESKDAFIEELKTIQYDRRLQLMVPSEDSVVSRLTAPIVHTYVDTEKISFERSFSISLSFNFSRIPSQPVPF